MDKSKLMMTIIIVLLVLLLGTIVGVAFFAMNALKGGPAADETHTETVEQPVAAPKLTLEQITQVPLSKIETNLRVSDDGVQHYIKITLAIGVNNTVKKESPAMIKRLEENEAVTLDIINGVLRNKTREELANTDLDTYQALKDEITWKLQEAFETNLIADVYIVNIAY